MTSVSHATRALGSRRRTASSMASEIWSATLSGWPSVTDSDVNRNSRGPAVGIRRIVVETSALGSWQTPADRPMRRARLPDADLSSSWRERRGNSSPGRGRLATTATSRFHGDRFFELLPPPGRRPSTWDAARAASRATDRPGYAIVGVDAVARDARSGNATRTRLDVHLADTAALPFATTRSTSSWRSCRSRTSTRCERGDSRESARPRARRPARDGDRASHQLGRLVRRGRPGPPVLVEGRTSTEPLRRRDPTRRARDAVRERARPLQAYAVRWPSAGLLIERLREPPLPERRGQRCAKPAVAAATALPAHPLGQAHLSANESDPGVRPLHTFARGSARIRDATTAHRHTVAPVVATPPQVPRAMRPARAASGADATERDLAHRLGDRKLDPPLARHVADNGGGELLGDLADLLLDPLRRNPRGEHLARLSVTRVETEVHVATRSPMPAIPMYVRGCAPNASPRRDISAIPRVMIAALALSP